MVPIPEAARWSVTLPALRDFLVSPGFAGAAVVIAAIIVFWAVLYASGRATRRVDNQLEQQDLHRQEIRADHQRSEAVDRCWERFVWLVETAGTEPVARDADEASLGLGPELALELLQGLHRDAKVLGDETLAGAVTVYLVQYGLVLGRQGGPLPEVVAGLEGQAPPSADGSPATHPPAADQDSPTRAEANVRKGRKR
jgi:uncharacterized membrane protein YedE/YeeE